MQNKHHFHSHPPNSTAQPAQGRQAQRGTAHVVFLLLLLTLCGLPAGVRALQPDDNPSQKEQAMFRMPLPEKPLPATGPLHTDPKNPHYFVDGNGKAVYLVGSHTWANFQDIGFEGDKPFDYDAYLAFMVNHRFNFMRFWTWEHSAWATWTPEKLIFGPLPYRRTGPGTALDGKPKFDLTQFDEAYFDRMRARILKARDNGVYASVMLFQAFSGIWPFSKAHQHDAFRGHYYNVHNNVQNFNGDKNGDSVLDINDPDVRRYEAVYLHKIIDSVNDLDNVLYEIINEGGNPDWNRFVIETVQNYEKTKPKQHPIGMTGHGGEKLDGMLASACEWISPGEKDGAGLDDLHGRPPVWNAPKVSVLDTDHIWGHGIDYRWVWKSFLRGHNVLFMDPIAPLAGWPDPLKNTPDFPSYEEARLAMRNTAYYAHRLNMAAMFPLIDLASTGYCLADPGREYLIYTPEYAEIVVDLTAATGDLRVEWMDPIQGKILPGETAKGGSKQSFWCPFANDSVLHIWQDKTP